MTGGSAYGGATHSGSAQVLVDHGPVRPIFVGGTGRSGTTVLGRLLGQHRDVALCIPRELKFLADRGGVVDAYRASVPAGRPLSRAELDRRARTVVRRLRDRGDMPVGSPEMVARRLETDWFKRSGPQGESRGLQRSVTLAEVRSAGAAYLKTFDDDPRGASRSLTARIVDPMAEREGKHRWVDTTPTNVIKADGLEALFPDLSLVHIMRDGRDTAASIVTQTWGPDDLLSALRWWGDRMREAHRGLSKASPGKVLVLQLEDLAARDREATLRRLLDFLGLEPDPAQKAWFDERLTPARSHAGRWRTGLTGAEQERVEAEYAAILARLDSLGAPRPV